MPVCETCGENDFHLLDGLYYCAQCHTQTQEMKEEEVENEDAYPNYLLEIKTKKSKSKKTKKEKKDPGRPWHTHEAWTIILKRQVESLIKMGANPKLKDVVLRLWVRYLSKCGVAFVSSEVQPHPSSVSKDRDQCAPSVENPAVSQLKLKKSQRKRFSAVTTAQKAREKKEKRLLQESLKGEELYEGDSPFGSKDTSSDNLSQGEDDSDLSGEEQNEKEGGDSGLNIRQHVLKSHQREFHYLNIECMTPKKTLSFCYLGLLYLHPLIVPSDLVRWAKAGKFPYRYQMFRSLPEDMKFCVSDFIAFWADKVPDACHIRKLSSQLCSYLELQSCFTSAPLELMCSRYIIEMNLPGEFHYLTRGLLKQLPFPLRALKPKFRSSRKCGLMETEFLAMGCIIVVLKLLCGLDGSTEKKISSCARKIHSMFKLEQHLFVFEDWLHYMEHTQHSSHLDPFSSCIEDLSSIRDMSEIFRTFSEKQEEQRTFSARSRSSRVKTKAQTKATQENLQKPFLALLEKHKLQKQHSDWNQQATVKEEEDGSDSDTFQPTENSLMALFQESPKMPVKTEEVPEANERLTAVSRTGNLIKQSTVAYILDKKFMLKLSPRLQAPDFEDVSPSKMSATENQSHNPSQSLFSESNWLPSDSEGHFDDLQPNQTDRTIGETEKETNKPELDEVLKVQDHLEMLTTRKKYVLTQRETNWTRSYDRTLNVCSQLIGCNKKCLNWHVWLMELFCLLTNASSYSKLRKLYTDVYFQVKQDIT